MSFKPFFAIMSAIIATALIGIIQATWGTALETMRLTFLSITPHLPLSGAWATIATTSANNISLSFDATVAFIIAIFVYAGLSLFTNADYSRMNQ